MTFVAASVAEFTEMLPGGILDLLELAAEFRRLAGFPLADVQVYRARPADPRGRCTEFLETMRLSDWITQDVLNDADADELRGICPLERTRLRWGGGRYQFRFRWRDEMGGVVLRRSHNVSIAGPAKPKKVSSRKSPAH